MKLYTGELVTWSDSVKGSGRNKGKDFPRTFRGKVYLVVLANTQPFEHVPDGYRLAPYSFEGRIMRTHESYVVAVGNDLHWPPANALHKVDEAKELAEAMSRYVNGIGNPVEDVVEHLSQDHRTLQQGITKFCVAWLERCAHKHLDGDFDLRNQASAELGAKFIERMTSQERAMPFI